jgi:DNA-binding NtrC family response regulator
LVLQLGSHFHVEEAATVDRALAMVADGRVYDVVLCDLMMPKVGAEGWLSSCASLDPRLADHTIVLTGGPTTEAASALVEARRDKVIFKPFEITHVQAMIERVARS